MELAHTNHEQQLKGEAIAALEIPDWMTKSLLSIALVGSAYILGAEKAKDVDILLLVSDLDLFSDYYKQERGYTVDGSGQGEETWVSLKHGKVNLLLCDDPDYFQKWKTAADVCRYLQLEDKAKRVDVHSIVMDGYAWNDIRLLGGSNPKL